MSQLRTFAFVDSWFRLGFSKDFRCLLETQLSFFFTCLPTIFFFIFFFLLESREMGNGRRQLQLQQTHNAYRISELNIGFKMYIGQLPLLLTVRVPVFKYYYLI